MLMFRFFKEVYLTGFTLGFRSGGSSWTYRINASKGAVGVALVEWVILIGVEAWIEILIGVRSHLDYFRWAVMIALFTLWFANYYVLVIRGHGTKFEREFSDLDKSRKTLLIIGFVAVLVAAIAFFYLSVSTYHHFFHIIPKNGW